MISDICFIVEMCFLPWGVLCVLLAKKQKDILSETFDALCKEFRLVIIISFCLIIVDDENELLPRIGSFLGQLITSVPGIGSFLGQLITSAYGRLPIRKREKKIRILPVSKESNDGIWQPVELKNLGNTCYYNAIMQNILNSHTFVDMMCERARQGFSTSVSQWILTKAAVTFFGHVRKKSDSSLSHKQLYETLVSRIPGFGGYRQQDSHELFRHLLRNLKEEEQIAMCDTSNSAPKIENSVVDEVFGLMINTVTNCKRCGQEEGRLLQEKFVDLTLSLPVICDNEEIVIDLNEMPRRHEPEDNQKHTWIPCAWLYDKGRSVGTYLHGIFSRGTLTDEPSLKQCLDTFIEQKKLYGEDAYRCDNCTNIQYKKQGSVGEKKYIFTEACEKTLIGKSSKILVLHLNRFRKTSSGFTKDGRHVKFPLKLDIAPFCSMDMEDSHLQYSLYGTIEHSGGLQGGHYIAYVRGRNMSDRNLSSSWYRVNDISYIKVTENDVLKSEAYMLFYEKSD